MKAFIVEDSRLAREGLERMLGVYDQIEVIGAEDNIETALTAITANRPDVLFLDIHLPGGDGFELLQRLGYEPFVIFTTAFSEYAVQSFEYPTVDYLLKPISKDRLAQAINKLSALEAKDYSKPRLSIDDRIMIKDKGDCTIIEISDIQCIESCKNYVQIFDGSTKFFLKRPLTYVEERLPVSLFYRVSRQHIVNVKKIKRVEESVSNSLEITMDNGVKIEASRRGASKLWDLLSL